MLYRIYVEYNHSHLSIRVDKHYDKSKNKKLRSTEAEPRETKRKKERKGEERFPRKRVKFSYLRHLLVRIHNFSGNIAKGGGVENDSPRYPRQMVIR